MSTHNQQLAARSYQKQFRQLLQAVFQHQAYFRDFFGGSIEALDGVTHNETAFYVKTSDIPVVVGNEYIKDANVGFEEGTSNSSRFGPRKEIIYEDTPVPYTWEWVYHEGIDRHTVNADFNAAIADRLDLQARVKMQKFNAQHSEFISSVAEKEVDLTDLTEQAVNQLFDELFAHYLDHEIAGVKVARVNADLYNAIVNGGLAVREKGSTVGIDRNEIYMFKDFVIEGLPATLFQEGEIAYTYIPDIAKAFTGINTARTIESEDFDGLALQGAGKAGEFILDDNKLAVAKVTIGDGGGVEG